MLKLFTEILSLKMILTSITLSYNPKRGYVDNLQKLTISSRVKSDLRIETNV